MSTTIAERVQAAYNAGFRNTVALEGLSIIVAISLCECNIGTQPCDSGGCNYDCCPASQSCCQWQIFQGAHPGTAGEASTLQGCADIAFRLSGGTNFHPWTTYNDGCFVQHMDAVRAVIASFPYPVNPQGAPAPSPPPPSPSPPPQPTQQPIQTGIAAGSSAGAAVIALLAAVGASAAVYARHHRGAAVAEPAA